jgi:hypothetical protein
MCWRPGCARVGRVAGQVNPVVYELVVTGELGDRFAVLFDGMALVRRPGLTVLTGPVPDQARLVGLIERTQELGCELISVKQRVTTASSREQH